ncbi:MAG: acylphosphatase, partial [Pseudomonadota bacterium]
MGAHADISPDLTRERIRVRGAVQGVGFRPFVWKEARSQQLNGWVLNDEAGVLMEVEGPSASVARFTARLKTSAPPLSRVDAVESERLDPVGLTLFEIASSVKSSSATTMTPPDIATCPDCLSDMFEPGNRRYHYAFTNCTNCGPRYTIPESRRSASS